MFENEVISKYREYFDENGYLDYHKVSDIKNIKDRFYPFGAVSKDVADMNMLYSQICRKLGLEAPICFPVSTPVDNFMKEMGCHTGANTCGLIASFPTRDNETDINMVTGDLPDKYSKYFLMNYLIGRKYFNREVINNYKQLYDGLGKSSYISPVVFNKMYAINFCETLKESSKNFNLAEEIYTSLIRQTIYFCERVLFPFGSSVFDHIFKKNIFPKTCMVHKIKGIEDYFTQKAIKDRVTIALLDTAFLNTNREQDSSIYRLNDNKEVERVIPMFLEKGARNVRYMIRKNYDKVDNVYFNDFTASATTAKQTIEMYKKFSHTSQAFTLNDRVDLGIKMREVANIDVAGDIRDTIGYQIDKKLNDVVVHHLDKVGEELLK